MSQCLTTRGYLRPEDLDNVPGAPTAARRAKGPVAVFECVQEIPCNPCEQSCDRDAVKVGALITDRPTLVEDECTGCGKCVSACPGQAVFIVDESRPDEARVTIPYEFLPLPAKDEIVTALDRSGAALGEARIVRVRLSESMDRTAQVTMAVPLAWSMTARFFKRKESPHED